MPNRPRSVLFVFADQLRGGDLGVMGNATVKTPAIDAVAASGAVVTAAYATVPLCCPNRATMLTGQYPTTHRVVSNDLPLPVDADTMGEVASSAGLRTGYIGKWHLEGLPRSRFTPPGPRRHGFDFWAVYNCHHQYMSPKYYRDTDELIEVEGYEPEIQTDIALKFLDSVADDEGFFLTLSWGPPHDPYDQVPERYRAAYNDIELPPNVALPQDAAETASIRREIGDYYAAITALDEQFGRLVTRLKRSGRLDDTLIIFTSDHGDMLCSHSERRKQLPHEESAHVPLIMSCPDEIEAGTATDALLASIDLAPTILELAGLPVPGSMQGVSRAGAIVRGEPGPDEILMSNPALTEEAVRYGKPIWRAVRTRRYTYAETLGRVPWLLFDNDRDPHQHQNFIDDLQYEMVVKGLQDRLARLLNVSNDPFLDTEGMVEFVGMGAAWAARKDGLATDGPRPEDV